MPGPVGPAAVKMGKGRLPARPAASHGHRVANVKWITGDLGVPRRGEAAAGRDGSLLPARGAATTGANRSPRDQGAHARLGAAATSPQGLDRTQRADAYSAGTIGASLAAARSSPRRSTARRILATRFRNARVSGFGLRKCEANSSLISSGRQ